jgi:hypothetical protein
MSAHIFETTCECPACKGTGLYVGFAEGQGCAVVCSRCKGTGEGRIKIEWNPFRGRALRDGVERVHQANPNGATTDPRCGGMDYAAWLRGAPFPPGSENRLGSCPLWWAQATDGKKPRWDECPGAGYAFVSCPHYENREKCWERLDRERAR